MCSDRIAAFGPDVRRGTIAATRCRIGHLISDSDGDERGGYVTSETNGDAFLTR